ncbi:DUF2730 family protein [Mesorhizobium sp. 1M-11]|uniref:DUF2730 family protein n=1 Tax=Mesorhizobium sp. 1M-11 TaxID=1529006 RepID=UPI0006C74F26|nr:DUF2730 family protein [Mesorhizobium sp. 1M-11]
MDLNLLMPWLGALALFISLGTSIHTIMTASSKPLAAQMKKAEETLISHDRRIQSVEDELKHLPDRNMVHDLQLTLKDIQIEMAGVKAASEQSTRTSRRVEEWLVANSKAGSA